MKQLVNKTQKTFELPQNKMAKQVYQLLFANQSADSKVRYELVREAAMYAFLREITKEPQYTFRVHKKTLSVKGIKEGKNGYKFDVADAIKLTKIVNI